MTAVLGPVLTAFDAGLCTIRAETDGSKKPLGTWKKYESERPPRNRVVGWFRNGHPGWGAVCGAISGNLEMFEFEGRAVAEGTLDAFIEAADAAGLADLFNRISGGYCERTPTGGIHLLYRCEDAVDRNLQLARRPPTAAELEAKPDDKMKVLIETRGEGGFTILAPSNGTTHPNGGAWELMHGGFDTIAVVTQEERQAFLALARTFDQCPEAAAAPRASQLPRTPTRDSMPSEEFDSTYTCGDVLTDAGFTFNREDQNGQHYTRPGKATREGSSATVWKASRAGGDRCTLFSSSIDAPLEFLDGHRALTAWQLHVALNYGLDFHEAARQWRQDHPRPTDLLSWITQAGADPHSTGHAPPYDPAAADRDTDRAAGKPPDPALVARVTADFGVEGVEADLLAREAARRIEATALQRLARDLVDQRQAERDQHLEAIVTVRADRFVAQVDDPVRPLLGTLASEGHNVVLTARYKVGKTTVIENAVAALVTGLPFLDRFTITRPRRVVLLNYELTEPDQRARLKALGLPPADLERLHVVHLRGRRLVLTSPSGRDHLVRLLVDAAADVLIVDTFGAALSHCGLDENKNSEARRFLEALDEVKLLAGTPSCMLTAHTGRAQQEEGAEHARGATVLDDWPDVRLLLTKDDDGSRFLYSEGRAVDLPESRLGFNKTTGFLCLAPDDVGVSRRLSKADGVVDDVLRLVAATPGLSKRQLQEEFQAGGGGGGRNGLRDAIGLAQRRGHLHHHLGEKRAHLLYLGAVHHQDSPCTAAR